MTDLGTSPVTRRSTQTYKGRRIVASMRADDHIEVRLERLSHSYKVDLQTLYRWLERASAPHIPPRR